jgi:hypothetical protein
LSPDISVINSGILALHMRLSAGGSWY